jgi:hypothetical protein
VAFGKKLFLMVKRSKPLDTKMWRLLYCIFFFYPFPQMPHFGIVVIVKIYQQLASKIPENTEGVNGYSQNVRF